MTEISAIPAFSDNYIWLLRDTDAATVAVVDPGDADPVLDRLCELKLDLGALLITHHHYDHTGGIDALVAAFPKVRVFGPDDTRIKGVTDPVGEGDLVRMPGVSLALEVLALPGHTSSHIGYYGGGALFCGDTLFAAGCGRVFDGTMSDLAASLTRIAALPPETQCYCAHEYTLDNLGFAGWVEPDSVALQQREQSTQALREAGTATVPSTLSLECATNPFLRTTQPEVIARAEQRAGRKLASPAEVFEVLRRWKDDDYD